MGPKQGEIVRASPDAAQAYEREPRDIPEIRRDIEQTRGRLDETIDAIRGRLTPQSIGRQAMSVIRYRSKAAGRKMTDMLAEYPLPMALTSVGATWLVGQTIRRRRAHKAGEREIEIEFQEDQPLSVQRNLYDAGLEAQYEVREHQPGEGVEQPGVGEQAQQAGRAYGQQAREKAEQVGETARGKASEYGHRAADAGRRVGEEASRMGREVRDQASDMGHRVGESAQRASRTAWDAVQHHPITAAMAVLAAGLAVGLALPATRKERELVGEQRDELFDRARAYGGELAERGQAVAEKAGEAAEEEAERQDLTPEQLKAEAEQAGRELTEGGDEGEAYGPPGGDEPERS